MVLISLAILFAAIGALSLTGSDDSEESAGSASSEVAPTETASAPNAAGQAPAAGQSGTASGGTTAAPTTTSGSPTAADPSDVEVRVLNNSDVSGLAAETAATLTTDGWTVAETGNYSDTQIPATTVYYGTASGAQAAAREIAQQLGATAEARPATLSAFGNGVIVMVTQ